MKLLMIAVIGLFALSCSNKMEPNFTQEQREELEDTRQQQFLRADDGF